MNKTIQKFAVCSVSMVVAATGWGQGVNPDSVAEKPSVAKSAEKELKVLDGSNDCLAGVKYSADGTRLVSCDTNAVSVKIAKTVRLIHGNAFSGCAKLLRVHFLGDEPVVAKEALAELPPGCTVYAEKDQKGWTNENFRIWNDGDVRFSDEIEDMPMTLDGRIKIEEAWYNVRPCGDGVALLADPESLPGSPGATLVVPEKIGIAPVRILGDSVFPAYTNLAKVVIPASVTNFSISAFSRCGRPGKIEIAVGNPAYKEVDGAVYEINSKTVIICGTDVSRVKIPTDAQTIGTEAFKGCDLLASVELPPVLKSIGKSAFSGCAGLSIVTVPVDADVASNAFEGCCATVRKAGTYLHHEGFAGKCSEMRWIPEDMKAEGSFSDPLPLCEAVERAGKGDGFALYSLAIHCSKGEDARRDPVRAMKYLREAVSKKDANAEFLLGLVLESRMVGSDLNDPDAPGIAGRLGRPYGKSTSSNAITPFEKYIGVTSSVFADSEKAAVTLAGSLADEKDYELLRGVYESACQHGCSAALTRLEHLSYLSMLEFGRVEKAANRRILDALK